MVSVAENRGDTQVDDQPSRSEIVERHRHELNQISEATAKLKECYRELVIQFGPLAALLAYESLQVDIEIAKVREK